MQARVGRVSASGVSGGYPLTGWVVKTAAPISPTPAAAIKARAASPSAAPPALRQANGPGQVLLAILLAINDQRQAAADDVPQIQAQVAATSGTAERQPAMG